MAKQKETTAAETPAPNFSVKTKGHAERKLFAVTEQDARDKFKELAGILATENPIEVTPITEG